MFSGILSTITLTFKYIIFAIIACGPDEFRCEFSKVCIPEAKRCDDFTNCLDGSDENECGKKEYKYIVYPRFFLTIQNNICISSSYLFNHFRNNPDNNDDD